MMAIYYSSQKKIQGHNNVEYSDIKFFKYHFKLDILQRFIEMQLNVNVPIPQKRLKLVTG